MTENIQDAKSTIHGTDVEMMSCAKNSILVQSARTNHVPQDVLQLLD